MDNKLAIVIAILALLGFSIGVASDSISKDPEPVQLNPVGGNKKSRRKGP